MCNFTKILSENSYTVKEHKTKHIMHALDLCVDAGVNH